MVRNSEILVPKILWVVWSLFKNCINNHNWVWATTFIEFLFIYVTYKRGRFASWYLPFKQPSSNIYQCKNFLTITITFEEQVSEAL